jgi:hypothetical protein
VETVRFRIKVDRAAYVGVWTVEADGVYQLFPNAQESIHLFQAGEERIVPRLGAEAVPSRDIDRVLVEASTKPWNPVEGQRQGPFLLFQEDREREALAVELRGLRLNTPAALSEKVLPYLVKPRVPLSGDVRTPKPIPSTKPQ